MGRYIQRDTDRATDVNDVAIHAKALEASTDAAATLTASVPALATDTGNYPFVFRDTTGEGTTDWSISTYGAQLEVTAAGSSLTYTAALQRVTSDGSAARSTIRFMGAAASGTGLKSWSTSWDTVNNHASRASSDSFAPRVSVANSHMMNAEDITLRVNTADSYVDVPWDVGEPPPADTPRPAYIGGGYYG